ncbi:MAG: hypothetical protein A2X19_06765 [Bacteroidetes bacterium GWE2_39_28]|nr:MAG: hypothetical protein A2X19_06765 [Bacteroidetes bacterium GWE2_39_28]OFY13359.1 MAG: hypothetical protein A2X16_00280 [Bacteroidetes bacterium GWF2_39_10]OFZ12141.1 MAG: hypothetical protein A2465_08935 [Bacteroidetes bacterium RIFOXYC2_FULL_39_11]HCT94552.1 hypothetical protein [Rikenellaceae bacterium]
MNKIIITGGSGFLAKHTIKYLESKGYEVWDLTRKPNVRSQSIEIDITNRVDVETKISVDNIDAIIHLAAHIPTPENSPDIELCQKVNFDSTNFLLKFCCDNNIRRFIYISSLSIFDDNAEIIINEKSTPNPKSEYSISKLSAEYLCRFYSRNYQLIVPILRIGSIFGEGMNSSRMIPYFIKNCILNKKIEVYNSNLQLNISYIKDVVKIIEKLIYADSEIYHFTTNSISKRELVNSIAKVTSSNSKITYSDESIFIPKVFDINKIMTLIEGNTFSLYSLENGLTDFLKNYHYE